MCSDRLTTTGYRLADGRYFMVTNAGEKILAVRQPLFGSCIYPVPIRDVPESEWPEVLRLTGWQPMCVCGQGTTRYINLRTSRKNRSFPLLATNPAVSLFG